MTSLSRKSRRTTRRPATGRTATSLAAVLLLSLGAAADPPPAWEPRPPVPASPPAAVPVTFPATPAVPLPRLVPGDAPTGVGGRTVTFQKPAGQITTQPPAGGTPGGAAAVPPTQADPKTGTEAGKGTTGPAGKPNQEVPYKNVITRDTAFSRLESDAQLNKRILDELYREAVERAREGKSEVRLDPKREDYKLPLVQPVAPAGTVYVPKTVGYPATQTLLDPGYVVHRRLYTEDLNTERYGWDLGIIQPLVSAGTFYKDVFLFPAYFASHPHERYQTSAGKCRPGDPVPYYLYPPEIDIYGYAGQAAAIVGAAFVVP